MKDYKLFQVTFMPDGFELNLFSPDHLKSQKVFVSSAGVVSLKNNRHWEACEELPVSTFSLLAFLVDNGGIKDEKFLDRIKFV